MHRDYKVKRMDHDYVTGRQHKSIASVYGMCEIINFDKVSYSGDTFIRIRVGKHDRSNTYKHTFAVRDLFNLKLIRRKPILLLETDGF